MKYQDLLNSYIDNPRDVHTVPLTKKTPVWFHVMVKTDTIYVGSAVEHTPSSNISSFRSLNKNEFDFMLDLYKRRMNGESVSAEAIQNTVNSVYWYGIFNDLEERLK